MLYMLLPGWAHGPGLAEVQKSRQGSVRWLLQVAVRLARKTAARGLEDAGSLLEAWIPVLWRVML